MKILYKGSEVQLLPPIKRYVNAVERRLRLPRKIRARVMSDFATSICARREQGQTDDEIMAALGTPAQVAAELNEQMKDYTYRKSPWRFACLALAVLSLVWLLGYAILPRLFLIQQQSIGIIGGADGPTTILITSSAADVRMRVLAAVLLAVAGLLGYLRLRRCKRK